MPPGPLVRAFVGSYPLRRPELGAEGADRPPPPPLRGAAWGADLPPPLGARGAARGADEPPDRGGGLLARGGLLLRGLAWRERARGSEGRDSVGGSRRSRPLRRSSGGRALDSGCRISGRDGRSRSEEHRLNSSHQLIS